MGKCATGLGLNLGK